MFVVWLYVLLATTILYPLTSPASGSISISPALGDASSTAPLPATSPLKGISSFTGCGRESLRVPCSTCQNEMTLSSMM
jgi:hypothetical protein